MKTDPPKLEPTGFWQVLKALAIAHRARSRGRARRQQQLMQRKKGSSVDPGGCLAVGFTLIAGVAVHLILGFGLTSLWQAVSAISMEEGGKMVLETGRAEKVMAEIAALDEEMAAIRARGPGNEEYRTLDAMDVKRSAVWARFETSARSIGGSHLDDRDAFRNRLGHHYSAHGAAGFVFIDSEPFEVDPAVSLTPWHGLVVLVMVLWWGVMLAFQGEGLEMDAQRNEHPTWEWLLTHPVKPVAALAGELLGPFFGNPMFYTAPLFWVVVLWAFHGPAMGISAGLSLGLLLAMTISVLGKAVHLFIQLRMPRRSRGAWIGILSWLGFVLMFGSFFLLQAKDALIAGIAGAWSVLAGWDAALSWPLWGVWGWSAGAPSILQVVVTQVVLAVGLTALIWQLVQRGLSRGLLGSTDGVQAAMPPTVLQARFVGGNPLYRKELLWFWRDRSALVQVFLFPMTVGAMQAVNLGRAASSMWDSWNSMAGLIVIVGTYFLLVLGPRSLASEGKALWMTLTWPHDLSGLLAAKARLWARISSLVVYAGLALVAWVHPQDLGKILLVAVAWWFFAEALSFKSVTLVTAPSSDGDMPAPPAKRQWLAFLGAFTFSAGVMTVQWTQIIVGVVLMAALAMAMWQNFRARLPYLFDPWSERLPQAPTLLHAMVGILITFEVLSAVMVIATIAGDEGSAAMARLFGYGIVVFLAWILMTSFLEGRGVEQKGMWRGWRPEAVTLPGVLKWGVAGLGGLGLGGLGLLYVWALHALPWGRDWMAASGASLAPGSPEWIGVVIIAVVMAPIGEEFLFRGLLYRSLDRDWPGWRAMVGSAAFFAVLHPAPSWLPVFGLGCACAWLFQKGGRLLPCVLLHGTYNAVVILGQARWFASGE